MGDSSQRHDMGNSGGNGDLSLVSRDGGASSLDHGRQLSAAPRISSVGGGLGRLISNSAKGLAKAAVRAVSPRVRRPSVNSSDGGIPLDANSAGGFLSDNGGRQRGIAKFISDTGDGSRRGRDNPSQGTITVHQIRDSTRIPSYSLSGFPPSNEGIQLDNDASEGISLDVRSKLSSTQPISSGAKRANDKSKFAPTPEYLSQSALSEQYQDVYQDAVHGLEKDREV
jgi:hypothetical protein